MHSPAMSASLKRQWRRQPQEFGGSPMLARSRQVAIHKTLSFAEFTLDLDRSCLLRDGEEIKLRPKSYEMLKYLVENSGRLLTKTEISQAVWPDSFVTDDSLVQCVRDIRRALSDDPPQLVKTVARRGYIFTAEVIRSTLASP